MNAHRGASAASFKTGDNVDKPRPQRRWHQRPFAWVVLLPGLAFATTWVLPEGVTLGASQTDMLGQFVAWRAFAAESIRAGDFPFWNPYVFSGQPFLGGFQSALLYPPNLVFLVLPLARALTFSILLHLAILGGGMAWWARLRGVHPGVAAVLGIAMASSGVVFPHVYAGHLSNVCTMAWAPWAFGGMELWWRERRLNGLLLAAVAIALQVLGGQVQYVFLLAVAAGVFALAATIVEPGARPRALPGVVAAGLVGALLAAAQLLPGWEAAQEGVRQGRLDYGFASSFALPPENLLTALVPGLLGGSETGALPYWGRCYSWEMCAFVGTVALVFAVAAAASRTSGRRPRADLLVAAVLLVLALGRHLPVHHFLYAHVPGFGQFRGISKFAFPALLFVGVAAAAGLDAFVRGQWSAARVRRIFFVLAAALGLAAVILWIQPGAVRALFERIASDTHPDALIVPPKFPDGAAAHAAAAVARAAIVCLLAGAVAWAAGRQPRWRWALLAILPAETLLFAGNYFATCRIADAMPAELRAFVAQNRGDYRVLNLRQPNNGFLLGAPDLWGNDPGVLKRYAEFMTFTQGGDPNAATQNLAITKVPPIYAMLRCRYAFVPSETGVQVVDVPNPLPRALLISNYRIAATRDAAFTALTDSTFDPRHSVVLEAEPSPRPAATLNPPGEVKITASSVDSLTIEADLGGPAILLVTELYSRGWSAKALTGSTQSEYQIMPANYVLQAIPLSAGRHRLRVEYRPRTFALGAGLSIVGWLGFGAAVLVVRRQRAAAARSNPLPA